MRAHTGKYCVEHWPNTCNQISKNYNRTEHIHIFIIFFFVIIVVVFFLFVCVFSSTFAKMLQQFILSALLALLTG